MILYSSGDLLFITFLYFDGIKFVFGFVFSLEAIMKPPQATGAELRLRHAETNTSHAALSSQLQTCSFLCLSHQTPCPASLPTSENKGPVLIRKKCFAAVKRAESHPAATVLGRQRASGCLKLDKVGYGSPGHCCHGRHGYYDFIKKWDAPDLCSTSLE